MVPLQIKRWRNPQVDPKQRLRAHIDRLPLEKQREFVVSAFQLIAEREGLREAVSRLDPLTRDSPRE